jgi:hypothetical protein
VLAGPVGFDPTTTGFGGLRSFFLKEQHPILTRRRALFACLNLLIYETYLPQMTCYSLVAFHYLLQLIMYLIWLFPHYLIYSIPVKPRALV